MGQLGDIWVVGPSVADMSSILDLQFLLFDIYFCNFLLKYYYFGKKRSSEGVEDSRWRSISLPPFPGATAVVTVRSVSQKWKKDAAH